MTVQSNRLTTRRWLVIVAILASYLGACRWAEKWRVEFQYDGAVAHLKRQQGFYDEGRITIDRLLEASRDLMHAQIALSADQTYRVAAIQAHLMRVGKMIEVERKDLEEHFYHGGRAVIGYAEQMREEDEVFLARETGPRVLEIAKSRD